MFYPRKSDVKRWCAGVDGEYKGNSESTFDRCLTNLQKEGNLRVAQIKSGVDYRIYPWVYPDPSEADWVRTCGERV